MNPNKLNGRRVDTAAEDFAAELTQAAYAVALRHGVNDGWLDLELDIWKAMIESVNCKNQRDVFPRSYRE